MTRSYPDVILCNLVNSGSSAIDPILRALLIPLGYALPPFGPEGTGRLTEYLHAIDPLYHWTHDPTTTFASLSAQREMRFLYLYRDPRDVLISLTKDHLHRNTFPGMPERDLLLMLLEGELPRWTRQAREWLALPDTLCFKFRFEEMKADIPALLRRIFTFLGLPLDPGALAEAAERHSFENVAGRKRGEEGPILRTGYLLRRGVSGEWRRHFDTDVTRRFIACLGEDLIALGYEQNNAWHERVAASKAQIVATSSDGTDNRLACALAELGLRVHLPGADTAPDPERVEPDIYLVGQRGFPGAFRRLDWHTVLCLPSSDFSDVSAGASPEETLRPMPELSPAAESAYLTLLWRRRSECAIVLPLTGAEIENALAAVLLKTLAFLGVERDADAISRAVGAAAPSGRAKHAPALSESERCLLDAARAAWNGSDGQPVSSPGDRFAVHVTPAALLQALPPAEQHLLTTSQAGLCSGEIEAAQETLRTGLLAERSPVCFLGSLNLLIALRWSSRLCADPDLTTDTGRKTLLAMRDLNLRLLACESIQTALLTVMEPGPDPGTDPDGAARALTRLGEALYALGQTDAAERLFLYALANCPQYALPHNNLAVVYWSRGQHALARSHIVQALKIAPLDQEALSNAAAILS